jgi:hypothetical protein
LVRSVGLAASGAALVLVCYALIFVFMPSFTPFTNVNCLTPTQCFSGVNPEYPLVFVVSVAGTVVALFGVFGRYFVFSGVFAIGMIALEYGLAGAVSASLAAKSGPDLTPAFFLPFIIIGVVILGFQRYLQSRMRRNALQKHISR